MPDDSEQSKPEKKQQSPPLDFTAIADDLIGLTPPEDAIDILEQLELPLISEEALYQLNQYAKHMLSANRLMNLTGFKDWETCWHKNIVDSLTALPGLSELVSGDKVLDMGTGAGLPGMPLAICRPDLTFTLMDATGKKIAFIDAVAKELGLDHVSAVQSRAELLGQDKDHRQQYKVVTSRAVGQMNTLLEYTLPLVSVGGCLLAMKGPSVERELDAASDALMILGGGEVMLIDAYPEDIAIDTVIVCVEKAEHTPQEYPRANGLPASNPL